VIEARDLPPLAGALDSAVEPALRAARPLLLLDSWERMTALDAYLREELLRRLPASARVVLASRRAPAAGWFVAGWEHVVLDLALDALDSTDAAALLAARGIADTNAQDAAIAWAGGSPLALVMAAEARGALPAAAAGDAPPALVDRLLRRLLDTQPEGEARSVLAVAALARVTTPDLLAAALPEIDAERAFAWLCAHPSAEPLGDGVTLHDLVGRALRADLRRRSPDLERMLRRRLVDALYARSSHAGLLQLTLDLQQLVRNPALRWGFAWDASGRHRIDAPRAGDVDTIAQRSGAAALEWLQAARPYFEHAPELVTVIRDQDDAIAGYGIAATPANAPAFAAGDPVLGPRLRHAAQHVPGGGAVVVRQAVDLTHDARSPIPALLGIAVIIGAGLDNPAAAYLPIVAGDADAEAFTAACGARVVQELGCVAAGVVVACHVLDYGPGGLLAFQRAAVYRELGLPAPPLPPTLDAVREALRHYGSPARLAASALAPPGGPPAARAEALRARIDDAVLAAFGSASEDVQLRDVLVRGYLRPAATHELAAAELSLSRAAYFRRLRDAVERVARELGAETSARRPGH